MKYLVTVGDRSIPVEIDESSGELRISIAGKSVDSSVVVDEARRRFLMLLDSRSYDTEVFSANGSSTVLLLGHQLVCKVEDERLAAIREVAGIGHGNRVPELRAPMPGLVVKILRQVGDKVLKGEPLLIVEAMKMENELRSPSAGVIRKINARVGKAVDKNATLVIFEEG